VQSHPNQLETIDAIDLGVERVWDYLMEVMPATELDRKQHHQGKHACKNERTTPLRIAASQRHHQEKKGQQQQPSLGPRENGQGKQQAAHDQGTAPPCPRRFKVLKPRQDACRTQRGVQYGIEATEVPDEEHPRGCQHHGAELRSHTAGVLQQITRHEDDQ
jgi:hypothetical protein